MRWAYGPPTLLPSSSMPIIYYFLLCFSFFPFIGVSNWEMPIIKSFSKYTDIPSHSPFIPGPIPVFAFSFWSTSGWTFYCMAILLWTQDLLHLPFKCDHWAEWGEGWGNSCLIPSWECTLYSQFANMVLFNLSVHLSCLGNLKFW